MQRRVVARLETTPRGGTSELLLAGQLLARQLLAGRLLGGLLAALTVLPLSACGSSDEPEPDPTPPPAEQHVVLGTGEATFEPIDGEPRLRLVAGVQGGFHVWASFLVYGVNRERLDMLLETRVDDDPATSLIMRARIDLRDGIDADGIQVRTFAGFPAQIHDARCAQDKHVSVRVELSDTAGTDLTDTRHCIAEVPEQQRRDACN